MSCLKDVITSVGVDIEKRELFCTVGENVSWYSYYGKQYRVSSKIERKKKGISILSGNPTSGYSSEENKNTNTTRYMHSMSIAALFTIVRIWKPLKRPLIYKWRKTLWYIYLYIHPHIIYI